MTCAERPWFAPRSGRGDGRKVYTVTLASRKNIFTHPTFFFYPFFSPISWYPIVGSQPEASRTNVPEETPCTLHPWLARTAPGPLQESLVRDETRTSLPPKPSLTRTPLGQLCVAPWTSRSRPGTTEPVIVRRPYPLRHPGGRTHPTCRETPMASSSFMLPKRSMSLSWLK